MSGQMDSTVICTSAYRYRHVLRLIFGAIISLN